MLNPGPTATIVKPRSWPIPLLVAMLDTPGTHCAVHSRCCHGRF